MYRCMFIVTINILRPRQNGRHFPDDFFKRIFLIENVWIPIKISLKFVPKGPINNIRGLVQIMAWRRPGDKPLSEPMIVKLPAHICVTRPQWVKQTGCYIQKQFLWKAPPLSWDVTTWERQDGAAAELRFYRCGNAPAAELQRVCHW